MQRPKKRKGLKCFMITKTLKPNVIKNYGVQFLMNIVSTTIML